MLNSQSTESTRVRVDVAGRITLPAELRHKLSIEPGQELILAEDGQRPAQVGLGLDEGHVVTTTASHGRQLHAGRAATHHDQAFWPIGGVKLQLLLPAR